METKEHHCQTRMVIAFDPDDLTASLAQDVQEAQAKLGAIEREKAKIRKQQLLDEAIKESETNPMIQPTNSGGRWSN